MNIQALSGLEFAALYLCAGVFGLAAAKGAQYAIVASESHAPNEASPSSAPQPLMMGVFPHPRDVFLIAALRGGREAVAETILASATASRLLTSTGDADFFVGQKNPNAPEEVYDFGRRIGTSRISREDALRYARASAEAFEQRHEETLQRLGYRLMGGTKLLARLSTWVLGALVVLIGVARLSSGGLDVMARTAIGTELVLFGVGTILLARPTKKTKSGAAYEAWLVESTVSLRADVAARRTRMRDDIVLATALGGARVVPTLEAFYGSPERGKTDISGAQVAG